MTIMMMMMMIMTDPFTTNLVVKGPVAKGSVVKGAHPIIAILVIVIIIIIIVPCLVLKDPRYWFAQANRAAERAASIVSTSRYSRPGNSCDIDIENIDIRTDNSCNIEIEYVDIDNSRSIIPKPDECIQGTFKPASLQDSRLSTFFCASFEAMSR